MNTICLNRAAEHHTDVHETFCRSTWRGREEKGEEGGGGWGEGEGGGGGEAEQWIFIAP